MAKEKQELAKDEVKPEVQVDSSELIKKIAELEARVSEKDEKSLARVCKALGVSPDEVEASEKKKPRLTEQQEQMIECFCHFPVEINGKKYVGKVVVPHHVFEVLSQAMGDRKMRYLRELIGNEYMIQQVSEGQFQTRIVGKINEAGERIG